MNWIVINDQTGEWIDREYTREDAERNAKVCSDHNARNGHSVRYYASYKTFEEIEAYNRTRKDQSKCDAK